MKKIFTLLVFLSAVQAVATSQKAILAGGCFWCMEPPFAKLKGVLDVTSGYTGGTKPDPTYAEVSTGTTGHYEAVQIEFDPARISYEKILDVFWRNIDPTDPDGQFADRGSQYRTAIFYTDEKQKEVALASKKKLAQSGPLKNKVIVTEVLPAQAFYRAEDYHQGYYKKNALKYKAYRSGSGREGFLNSTWKDKDHL